MIILQIFAVSREKRFEGGQIDFAVGMQAAQGPLELGHGSVAVENLDLGDEPIESKTNGRIGNVVGLGQFLE